MNILSTDQEKYHFRNMCNLCRYAQFSQAQSHILIKSILITINKCLGGKVLQRITFLWPFGKNLVDKFNPQ